MGGVGADEYANLCFVMRAGQIFVDSEEAGVGGRGRLMGGGRLEKGGDGLGFGGAGDAGGGWGSRRRGWRQIGELFFSFLDGV